MDLLPPHCLREEGKTCEGYHALLIEYRKLLAKPVLETREWERWKLTATTRLQEIVKLEQKIVDLNVEVLRTRRLFHEAVEDNRLLHLKLQSLS